MWGWGEKGDEGKRLGHGKKLELCGLLMGVLV